MSEIAESIFTPGSTPEAIILNTSIHYWSFVADVKPLNVGSSDVEEIIWEILDELESPDDDSLSCRLDRLPDFSRLLCKHILEDDSKERFFKRRIKEFGMSIHEEVKNLGLYRSEIESDLSFPYRFFRLVSGMIVLMELKS